MASRTETARPWHRALQAAGLSGLLAAALSACAGSFSPADAAPPGEAQTIYACETIDVLFVIDNSNSMAEEQDNLIANFPRFVQRIEALQPRPRSYHVGVVSSDLGAGPYRIGTCTPPGDEGKLQHATGTPGCANLPRFLEGPSATLADDFACVAALGDRGCGYEQQLEAALVALTAQPYNQGFVRANAPLAIIFISDEDDCSAADPGIFDPDDLTRGDLRTRCVRLTEQLHPVARYVEAFRALKDDPRRLFVAALTGPPGALRFDPSAPDGVARACTSDAFGGANPGNRFAELVRAFGDQGSLHSLCAGDLAPALDGIAAAIEDRCID